jgi:large conductance mechanosensitive channel
MTKILDEFKTFAFRGNLLDLAAAIILGLAFNTVVQALVGGVIMPVIAALAGRPDFDELTIGLGDAEILYGTFLTAVVNFLLVAFALFLVVRTVNRAMLRANPPPPTTRECPHCFTAVAVAASRCPACTSELEPL